MHLFFLKARGKCGLGTSFKLVKQDETSDYLWRGKRGGASVVSLNYGEFHPVIRLSGILDSQVSWEMRCFYWWKRRKLHVLVYFCSWVSTAVLREIEYWYIGILAILVKYYETYGSPEGQDTYKKKKKEKKKNIQV